MARERLISIALFVVGLVNFLSVLGFLNIQFLRDMFYMAAKAPEVASVMQNRAVLFGIIGGILMVAAFESHMRFTAFIAGSLAMAGFLAFYLLTGLAYHSLFGMFILDFMSFVLLLVALIGHIQEQKAGPITSRQ